ncbi:hypothetical protein COY52_10425 [Candidatus Desantisbacteria bacterium CG_4_10_14_0_8_um_filter_48_22]|uniref:Dinitrogenase iron-molybdenum cofactor biosynthesis domain-containing protein n=1 Tax=Candidatus Desantisbacteria bacterium CG_4_10_14_0_8_um_filter_48_22 TaxID=1974543 RepID=A0A2M7S6P4_9BACT|nr:MAG: hypothetical protein COS16_01750 [Candidatus Desantisbacteria bacterium CG02_land_8_20_14_3_00_49_13]PIZ15139.1 MAG: hypothetical protein COY52_10425 [Candidatus Desantisbacteria bacterium CG_4_10_14_0_8_um_filter_48_22]
MKVGVTLEDEKGLLGNVAQHFGQCKYFFLANIEDNKIKDSSVVPNTVAHGGGGCVVVGELLKYKVTHIIAGSMGLNAQNKLAQAGVKIFGYSGRVNDAIDELLKGKLGGLEACREHGGECH